MVLQTDRNDCGKACVRDVLFLVHEEESLRIAPLDGECQNFSEMKKELLHYGLTYEGYESDLRDGIDKKSLPAICLIKQAGTTHFVVLRKVKKRGFVIDDPQFGELTLSKEEFLEAYQKRILMKENVGPKPSILRMRYFTTAELVLFFLLFFVQMGAAVLSIYSMAESLSLLFSFAGMLVFLGSLFALYLALRKARKRMEETYFLPYILETREREDVSKLSRFFDLKVKGVTDIFTHALLLFLLILIFTSNGLFYFLIGLLGFLFSFFAPIIQREKRAVERRCSIDEENFLSSLKSQEVKLESFRQSKDAAGRFLSRLVLFQVSKAVVMSMAILAFMLVTGQVGFNYFLFSLLLCFSIERTTSSLFRTMNEEESDFLLNSLSQSFPAFLLKKHLTFRYNRRKEEQEADDTRHP